ncbi:MAG: hypothetical protein KID04_14485 [Clostridium sp.]|nr:hypothetical protein [Clostridium sp.]DAI95669.1 MAG TPA: hypothetical protein [Caudoviricetes sp.]
MTAKELIEYLSGFDPDENVSALILDLQRRLVYKVDGHQLMTDAGFPVLLFELEEAAPMDDMVEEAEDV